MRAEMPKKYWDQGLETNEKARSEIRDDDADDWRPAPVPATSSLAALEKAARTCTDRLRPNRFSALLPGHARTRRVLKSELAPRVLATVHPSSLLRQPDEESREREYADFVADLRAALKASAGK